MGITDPPAPFIYKNGTYEIKVVSEPDGKCRCYGITNRQTGVIEAYISQLAKAMLFADQFEEDLKVGFKTTGEGSAYESAFIAALTGSKKEPRGGGSLQ